MGIYCQFGYGVFFHGGSKLVRSFAENQQKKIIVYFDNVDCFNQNYLTKFESPQNKLHNLTKFQTEAMGIQTPWCSYISLDKVGT